MHLTSSTIFVNFSDFGAYAKSYLACVVWHLKDFPQFYKIKKIGVSQFQRLWNVAFFKSYTENKYSWFSIVNFFALSGKVIHL